MLLPNIPVTNDINSMLETFSEYNPEKVGPEQTSVWLSTSTQQVHLTSSQSPTMFCSQSTQSRCPYAIKNQRKARNAPCRGHFGCLELVLYFMRVLAEQFFGSNLNMVEKTELVQFLGAEAGQGAPLY